MPFCGNLHKIIEGRLHTGNSVLIDLSLSCWNRQLVVPEEAKTSRSASHDFMCVSVVVVAKQGTAVAGCRYAVILASSAREACEIGQSSRTYIDAEIGRAVRQRCAPALE